MAFFHTFLYPTFSISFWRIEEREDEMLAFLPTSHTYTEEILSFKSTIRIREWLSTRCLLHHLLGSDVVIRYTHRGRPWIEHSDGSILPCSVSHSGEWVAIAFLQQPGHTTFAPCTSATTDPVIGIDIEMHVDRAWRLRHRFLTPEEQKVMGCTPHNAAAFWCAKEAAYKLCDAQGLTFLGGMKLSPTEIPRLWHIALPHPWQQSVRLHTLPECPCSTAVAVWEE